MGIGTLVKRISRPGIQAFLNHQRRSLVFKVERSEPELISPVKPTPYEFKNLSNLDDQYNTRLYIPLIQFYHNNVKMEGKDPAKVIKEAIAKALVFYYPFAGRLREGLNHKLKVECTGEGVMFIEANADVRLEQLGDLCSPPFTGIENLLYNGPGSGVILNSPLLLIQVTRFLCGGFVCALHLNHVMSDGAGKAQFVMAVGELACGAQFPSVQPVWRREILNARDPPQILCNHSVYQLNDPEGLLPLDDNVPVDHRSFFFGRNEIEVLRNNLPPELRLSTKFEILAACLWRSRTLSLLSPISDDKIGLAFTVNARNKLNPPLPVGYYGNAFGMPVAWSTATKLCNNPLGYAVELIKKAKEDVTDEFMRSLVDLFEEKFVPCSLVNIHGLSDQSRMGYNDVDFGWGKPIYGGPVGTSSQYSFFGGTKNSKDDNGISMSITLPCPAMEKFAMEIDKLIT